uniref:Synapse differentiation inducing 1-like n=1 Tax=Seriola lalandi dorsalis TaxID=1841481 RepID=A0A3B4XA62_SERLL
MENLSELQNPLLDKNSKHMVNGYGGDFPNNQYQENIINYFAGGGGYNTNGKVKSQQLLDATSLHLAVEAFYRPNFILYKEDSGSIKAKEYKSECCETTFTEKKAKEASNTAGADTPGTEDPQAKLLEDGEHIKIQTVSYEVEEEEYVEYEVREKIEKEKACLYSYGVCTLVSSHQRIGLDASLRLTIYQTQIPFDPLTLIIINHPRWPHTGILGATVLLH